MRKQSPRGLYILLLLLGASSAAPAAEGGESRELWGARWVLEGDARVETLDDRTAVAMGTGSLRLEGADFENGTIEFEARSSGLRSFVGVMFRTVGPHRESFYLRPHNSGRFDAMQYTPVYNDISAWQLHPEHNARRDLPPDRWIKVKLVVAGPRLDVYIDEAAEPALSVASLGRGRSRGGLALWSFFPGAGTGSELPTRFSRARVTPDRSAHAYPPEGHPSPESGLIDAWQVSAAFAEPDSLQQLPPASGWTPASTDEQGRLNIARWAAPPGGKRPATVLVRTFLHSRGARVVRLGFGFSDRGTIFLNGAPLFQADNTYRSRSERYLGVMGVNNDTLHLPLKDGSNELVLAVSESFGGWGVVARLLDGEGVTVRSTPLRD